MARAVSKRAAVFSSCFPHASAFLLRYSCPKERDLPEVVPLVVLTPVVRLVDSESLVVVPALSEVPEEGRSWLNMPSMPESRKGPPAATSRPETPASPAAFATFPPFFDLSSVVAIMPLLVVDPFVSEVPVVVLVEVVSLSLFATESDVPVLVELLMATLLNACTCPARVWQAITMPLTSLSVMGSAISR